jgi:hypothetical protein
MTLDKLVQPIVYVCIALVGWWFANHQFNKQFQKNLELQYLRIKTELEINTAKEAIKLLREISDLFCDLDVFVSFLVDELKLSYSDGILQSNITWKNPHGDLTNYWQNLSNKLYGFVHFFLSSEVILHNFKNTQECLFELTKDFQSNIDDLYQFLYKMHTEKYKKNIQLTPIEIDILADKKNVICNKIRSFQHLAYEFEVDLQNAFLSEMFGYTISKG